MKTLGLLAVLTARAAAASLEISALTPEIGSDWTAVYYDDDGPLLVGNDGTTASGGVRVFSINDSNLLDEVASVTPGRTKLVTTVYTPDGEGVAISIAQTTSIIRAYTLPDMEEKEGDYATYKALGDWSALCSWRSHAGNWYFFLLGKMEAIQFSVQFGNDHSVKIYKVRSFDIAAEASSCAVSQRESKLFYSFDDSNVIDQVELVEDLSPLIPSTFGSASDEITGLAMYSDVDDQDWLFIAMEDKVEVKSVSRDNSLDVIELSGLEDIEVQGLSVLQSETDGYPYGALAFAIEHGDGIGFGIASLKPLEELGIQLDTEYYPADGDVDDYNPLSKCQGRGYSLEHEPKCGKCSCFPGWEGKKCNRINCDTVLNCSGHGTCVGPNVCNCDAGRSGPACTFKAVKPKYETDAYGADGDDPAIWISPSDPSLSRVITTTKSEKGAGLSVFDLQGNRLQSIEAGEPNNVNVIYGFQAGNRTIDLAYAACRVDDTLCIFEITADGTLQSIPGGIQPVIQDYSVYGSCTYHSPTSGKQYLFVNSKTSEYLQYELSWSTEAEELTVALTRSFMAGSGGQVEGCVADEVNRYLFAGEEPKALWRYEAEPSSGSNPKGYQVAVVGDGTLNADVEGVTLVYGKKSGDGFILVSNQGISTYSVFKLAPPHEYVLSFTVTANAEKDIDKVTNTDGIAAVGTALGDDFPAGLVVVHDDANELPDGSMSEEASFKLVSLVDVLGELIEDVDTEWNPRSAL